MFKLDGRNKRVLIIPDLHEPYSHKDCYKFLRAVKARFKPQLVINLGDEVDYHRCSFHNDIPSMDDASTELKKAKRGLDELERIFKKMYLLDSNHGSLVYRRMSAHGIPHEVILPMKDLYEKPKWTWHDRILLKTTLGDVFLTHGKTGTYDKLAKEMGCSSIQGHFHTKFFLVWLETARRSIFNMVVGCLADRDHMAFSYAKNNVPIFQLGCSLLDSNGYPRLIKMNLKPNGRWDGKLPT